MIEKLVMDEGYHTIIRWFRRSFPWYNVAMEKSYVKHGILWTVAFAACSLIATSVMAGDASAGELVSLRGKGGTAVVDLQGGRVVSWKTVAGEELLFMPRLRVTPGGDWSHGGIGICWPWFGKKGTEPSSIHGFARNRTFMLQKRERSDDGESIVIALDTKEGDCVAFPCAARLELEVSMTTRLTLRLRTMNRGSKPFELSEGFQPYFAVSRYDAISISGVKAAPFAAVNGMDAAFQRIGDAFSLKDAARGRTISCVAKGNTGVVVWSPGNVEPHNRNLAAGDTERFIGLGPSNRTKEGPVVLAPGASHELLFEMSLNRD